jgi:hypothetical protein
MTTAELILIGRGMSKSNLGKGGTGTLAHQLQGDNGDNESLFTPDNTNLDNGPNFTDSGGADTTAPAGPFVPFTANEISEPAAFYAQPGPSSIKNDDLFGPRDATSASTPGGGLSNSLAQNLASNDGSVQIDVTFDQSVLRLNPTLASEIETAVDYVVGVYQGLFANPITINIDVGWGEVDGQRLGSGDLGESVTNTNTYIYSQVLDALRSSAEASGDPAQLEAVSSLPVTNPTSGDIEIADAEAQALGLLSGTPTVDGYVGFDSNSSIWSFSPTATPAANEYYFIGVAEHEISEVMGRISGIADGADSLMDLFRYSAPGERDLNAGSTSSNSTAYFSINGGDTNLGTWNNVPAKGDLGDWDAPNGPIADDAYNASSNPGVINTISANDLTLMNVLGYDLSCFLAGTSIRTPDGEVAVEELSRGDLVMTTDGGFAPIAWIGRRNVRKAFADPLSVMPIRIKANALGDQVPSRDLLLSPDHAILVDDVLIQAGALVNASSIVRETNVPEAFTYYHVELDDHSLILAENTPAETFIDNVDRLAFDNWDEHGKLYSGTKPIVELPHPRAKAHRQVPRSIRERLAARAALLGPREAAA